MGDYLCLSKEEVNEKFFEFIKKLKERLLDYQYQTNPQLNEYCHANIVKQIDKLAKNGLIHDVSLGEDEVKMEIKCVVCGDKKCLEGFCHNCKRCWNCMDLNCKHHRTKKCVKLGETEQ